VREFHSDCFQFLLFMESETQRHIGRRQRAKGITAKRKIVYAMKDTAEMPTEKRLCLPPDDVNNDINMDSSSSKTHSDMVQLDSSGRLSLWVYNPDTHQFVMQKRIKKL
jgi:hypothetical protein